MQRYNKYIMPYIKYFILGASFMLAEVLGEIAMPYLLGVIINNGIANKDISYILSISAIMVLNAFFMMAGGTGAAYFAARASVNFATDLRSDVFAKIQKFSFLDIDKFSTGSLITRLTNDISQLQRIVTMSLRMMLRVPGMLIGSLIMAFILNTRLAFVILFSVLFLIICIALIMKFASSRFDIMQRNLDKLNNNIQEMLMNIRVIKSFVRQEYEEEVFASVNTELKDSSRSAFKIMILQSPAMSLCMNLTIIAVLWFGGNQILKEEMPVGDLSTFIMYITQILMSLNMLATILTESARAVTSAKRVNEVLDAVPDLNDNFASNKEAVVNRGSIEFKNVTYRYYKDREEKILNNISFKINQGETVGIIGSTGCGKTTLVQMIPRLYDVDEGEVFVDGINVRDYSLKNLREGVGMVLQKNILFSGSIIENLRWGSNTATMEEIESYSTIAQAHSFISTFTDGYETNLGQGGVNVSGGQKQRLCIARALLKEPKILILDDSTSAVDTATEQKIREAFDNQLKGNTKIVIAQRISSVITADKIIVMDEGKIVGLGSHRELLSSCKVYQEIYSSQMESAKEVRG